MPEPEVLNLSIEIDPPLPELTLTFECHMLRKDHWGQLILDQCPSDPEHLLHPSSTDGMRPTCRYSLANLIPSHMYNKKGRWKMTFSFEEETNASDV